MRKMFGDRTNLRGQWKGESIRLPLGALVQAHRNRQERRIVGYTIAAILSPFWVPLLVLGWATLLASRIAERAAEWLDRIAEPLAYGLAPEGIIKRVLDRLDKRWEKRWEPVLDALADEQRATGRTHDEVAQ